MSMCHTAIESNNIYLLVSLAFKLLPRRYLSSPLGALLDHPLSISLRHPQVMLSTALRTYVSTA